MFYVKSCLKEFNIKTGRTLKIGTLNEYRETEEAQIADLFEGTFSLNISLSDVHIETHIFNDLNYNHNSEMNVRTDELFISGLSPLFQNCMFLRTYKSSSTFSNNNRFAFCISRLKSHEDGLRIFKDYDDYWYFKEKLAPFMAIEISKSLLDSINKLTQKGIEVFEGKYNLNKLKILYKVQSIKYKDRSIMINNDYFYKNKHDLSNMLSGILFIKPETFAKENEVRFLFDFYEEDRLLHPKIKNVIIDATESILAITHEK